MSALDNEAFALAVEVPLGTLSDWLRAPPSPVDAPAPAASVHSSATSAQMQTVLDASTCLTTIGA